MNGIQGFQHEECVLGEVAYVNGEFCDLKDALVSVEDRGFQFADGIYEGILAYDGKPFRMGEHLVRLRNSAHQIRLAVPRTDDEIERIVAEGIRRCGSRDVHVYIQVTRGVAPRSHPFPKDTRPTIVMTFKPRVPLPTELRDTGAQVITLPDDRWARCRVKSIMLLPNALAKQEALDRGAYDAIFYGPNRQVREATSSNVFVVREGRVVTPPRSENILRGITRDYILECMARDGIEACEAAVHLEDLYSADEVFLAGTTTEVLGVVSIDDRLVGEGKVGPITRRIYQEFFARLSGG